jgi:hypothetical protein
VTFVERSDHFEKAKGIMPLRKKTLTKPSSGIYHEQ